MPVPAHETGTLNNCLRSRRYRSPVPGSDAEAEQRLRKEARAAAALDHPFICKIYDTGQLQDRTFISMEYVKGETLKQRLARGPIPLEEALRIAAQVAEALEAAAEKHIVHRDIKPANVMVHSGEVKLIDVAFATVRPSPWRQAVDLDELLEQVKTLARGENG